MSRTLHVVFGAGQVGTPLAAHLLAEGAEVRMVRRSDGAAPQGVQCLRGDATDADFCRRAAEGADVLYHCMNPPYAAAAWADLLPRWADNLLAAAAHSGARLVVLDNIYMLGKPNSHPFNEDAPLRPCSRKGEARARVAERLFDAHRRGDVRVTSGRASDFYGPHGRLTFIGDHFWPAALAGRTVQLPIDPDAIHTYHYLPDVVAGLAALGRADDDAYGAPWMLPCQPAGTLRDLVGLLGRHLGQGIRVKPIPSMVLRTAGLFVPMVRELMEMRYQWDRPFVVDDSRFRKRFGMLTTDPDRAAADTVAWARRHYAVAH